MIACYLIPGKQEGKILICLDLLQSWVELGGARRGRAQLGFRSIFYQAQVLVGEQHMETCGNMQKTKLKDVCEALLMKVVTGKMSYNMHKNSTVGKFRKESHSRMRGWPGRVRVGLHRGDRHCIISLHTSCISRIHLGTEDSF